MINWLLIFKVLDTVQALETYSPTTKVTIKTLRQKLDSTINHIQLQVYYGKYRGWLKIVRAGRSIHISMTRSGTEVVNMYRALRLMTDDDSN